MPVSAMICMSYRMNVYSAVPIACTTMTTLQDLQRMAGMKLIGFELSREEGLGYELLNTPKDLPALAALLHNRLRQVLDFQVSRLDTSYSAFAAAAAAGHGNAEVQEATLRSAIDKYFQDEAAVEGLGKEGGLAFARSDLPLQRSSPQLLTAVRAVVQRNEQQGGPALTAEALARILHGLGSATFPASLWMKRMGPFWGSLSTSDFAAVLAAARLVLTRAPKQDGSQGIVA
jgi:hypothetical protein